MRCAKAQGAALQIAAAASALSVALPLRAQQPAPRLSDAQLQSKPTSPLPAPSAEPPPAQLQRAPSPPPDSAAQPQPAQNAAASKATRRPPAVLHVPKRLQEERAEELDSELEPLSPLGAPEVLAALGPLVPEVGAWVEYAVRAKGAPAARVRLSVLPPALPEGRYWLELVSATESGLAVATRLLVHGDPLAPGALERILVYIPNQAQLEIPVSELDDSVPRPRPPPTPHAQVSVLVPAQVRVKAGAFAADKLRVVAGGARTLLYRARGVPLWGLVKSEGAQVEVELLGFARTGAHSVFPRQEGDGPGAPAAASQGNGSESTK